MKTTQKNGNNHASSRINVVMNDKADRQLFIETLTVITVTILLFFTFHDLNSITPIIPAVYLLIEKKIRHRTWADIGFNARNIVTDSKKNWYLILFVGVISPLFTCFIGKYCVPGFIEHVKSRLPMNINAIIPVILTITIGTFLEEIIFRGFIQGRLEWFITPTISILITSCLFAFMHYSSGSLPIVALDMFGIFIDSILYGIIFTKTKNIFASWIGHYLSDLVGIASLIFFLK